MSLSPVVKITAEGAFRRVLNGVEGMTFVVDKYTRTGDGKGWVAHVKDYRYLKDKQYAIWSLGPDDYVQLLDGVNRLQLETACRAHWPSWDNMRPDHQRKWRDKMVKALAGAFLPPQKA